MIDEKLLETLSIQVGLKLKEQGKTVTTAESCTGGWVAKVLTDISGSSDYFQRGFVTYSNEAKHQMIGVKDESLQRYGAVSQQVVTEMATGALQEASADFAVSVSGIAGPGGGSVEKPVGTVWFGFAQKQADQTVFVTTQHRVFQGNRNEVRFQSTVYILETLLKQLN
ncbi:nicotinamide-nucleotide amidase [Providencia huaxiensis]|uniref:Nicotinamide-nucleotide amidase n=1 Tax=Providencia huaxiensis TaxID=2027290 RepID=A0ABU2IUA2_9GAMM|nr:MULTISPECIES: nicotinamide-nucleotide amidase [Providencia]MBZ3683059.1 nicotinamide-nucleotide amidase [Providencia rettgeri]AXH62482.1 nicotinamide-nucleotide amidase [Providencia huaxiensis]MBN6360831.1 nicotinamide-nucleotide amidase [Providencia huaxiensis]MCG9535229.1 nicotinamide-nucleotide amidase [Providencia huaxiensis]MDT0132656.1 nicotinamide-nucleotide amidase [Providencia huaxiensis]